MLLARARRAFIRRVVGFLAADRGVRQYIDTGTRPGIAAAVQTAARVHHPAAVAVNLGADSLESVLRGIDPAAPAALLLLDSGARGPAESAALVRAAHALLGSGGHVVVARPLTGPDTAESTARLLAPFRILDPGLADMAWWPYPDDEVAASGTGVLAGVAGPG